MAYAHVRKDFRSHFEKELKNHLRSYNSPEFKMWCLAQFIATGKPEFYYAGTTNNYAESQRVKVSSYIADVSGRPLKPAISMEKRLTYLSHAAYTTKNAYMARFEVCESVFHRDLIRIKEREGIVFESRGDGVYKRI